VQKEKNIINWEHNSLHTTESYQQLRECSLLMMGGMSYIFLRELWFYIIVLNVHAPSENKVTMQKSYEELQQVFLYHFPKYNMKNLLGDFNEKLGREDIFKSTIGNGMIHQDSNDNGIRIASFATSKF